MPSRQLCLVFLSLLVAFRALASDRYVAPSPTGSNSNDGSSAHPWATIQYAASKAQRGDVIHVRPGTYKESVSISTANSGNPPLRIAFVSETHWAAKIDGGTQQDTVAINADYIDFDGFDVTSQGYYGIHNRGSYVRIRGNHVHDIPATGCPNSGGAGIDNETATSTHNEISGNVVHHIGPYDCSYVHGIYQAQPFGTIRNNISYKNGGWGIHCWHSATDLVISNNLIFSNGAPSRGGIVIGASTSGVVAKNCLVTNNIVLDNPQGIREMGSTGANTYVNNLIWRNSTNQDLQTGTITGTINQNPGLVNYQADGSGQYQLAQGSPCIDSGTSQGAPSDDIDGRARPYGAAYDIGPYEWTPSGSFDASIKPPDSNLPQRERGTLAEMGAARERGGTLVDNNQAGLDNNATRLGDSGRQSQLRPLEGCACHLTAGPDAGDCWWLVVGFILICRRRRGPG